MEVEVLLSVEFFTSSGLEAFQQQASAKPVQLLAYVAPAEQHGDQAEGEG